MGTSGHVHISYPKVSVTDDRWQSKSILVTARNASQYQKLSSIVMSVSVIRWKGNNQRVFL